MSRHGFRARRPRTSNFYEGNGGRPQGAPRNNRKRTKSIDPARFINRSVETTFEEEVYVPTHQFGDFALIPELQQNIAAKGYSTPTPIQDQTIPQGIEGKDILGIANTGTGKTAAFLLPLINKMYKNRQQNTLILAPTRELATQINDEFRGFTRGMKLFSVVCIGGASINVQMSELRRGYNIVIATPGRLLDLVNSRAINLSRFQNVVLDEVDLMFDMGFINDVKKILAELPKERQSLFFSATITPEIDALIKTHMQNPITVSLKKRDTAHTVDQDVIHIKADEQKIEILHDMLIKTEFSKVLIFGRTKRGVHRLSEMLDRRGFKVDAIHGDKSQAARQRALTRFKQNHINILVATDVAARGIDIPNVSHVINYEVPESYEDYVHRIGRTGRANQRGIALTFIEGGSREQSRGEVSRDGDNRHRPQRNFSR